MGIFKRRNRKMDNKITCTGCPYYKECGTMISNAKLVKAGLCQISKKSSK